MAEPKPRIIQFTSHPDERGILKVIEGEIDIPFEIKRVFWIYGVPHSTKRAGHAHKKCQQLIVPICGSFRITAQDYVFYMGSSSSGILIPTGCTVTLDKFSDDAVCMVLASEHYEEDDYVS